MPSSAGGNDLVQVYVRTRPTARFANDQLKIDTERNSVQIHRSKPTGSVVNNQQQDWNFKVSGILHNASQEEVYNTTARDIVDSVLDGYNGTIMAYGQTGAGKTFTMAGGSQDYHHRGVIPRSIHQVFQSIADRPELAMIVRVSYLEIYNETFFDLLQDDGGKIGDLAVQDTTGGNITVKGLSQRIAESEEAALNLLFQGEANRAIAEHKMNKQSTRSHCIFTIHLEARSRVESREKCVVSKLNLVDLAGSERVGKTGSTGATLKEAKYINKSLAFLEQVVVALSSKNRDHVPFRQSKLTNVLRDSLGGNCKTRMIANLWTEKEQMEETVSTLKFAMRMMKVSNTANLNVQLDPMMLVKKYQREIRDLKQELAMHDTLANRGIVSYGAFTPEQQSEIKVVVDDYIKGSIQDIEIVNVRQIKEVFGQFKNVIVGMQASMEEERSYAAQASLERTLAAEQADQELGVDNNDATMVGELDQAGSGFSVGSARPDARPSSGAMKSMASQKISSVNAAAATMRAETKGLPQRTTPKLTKSTAQEVRKPSEEQGFRDFISDEGLGAEQNKIFQENKQELALKKQALVKVSQEVNAIKRKIDIASESVNDKRNARTSQPQLQESKEGVEVIDEEEYALIKQLKDLKRQYQATFQERKGIQSEVAYLKNLTEKSKVVLCNSFLEWFAETYGPEDEMQEQDERTDYLDDGEQFQLLERTRVLEEDPDSLSFYNASKFAKKKSRTGQSRKPLATNLGQSGRM